MSSSPTTEQHDLSKGVVVLERLVCGNSSNTRHLIRIIAAELTSPCGEKCSCDRLAHALTLDVWKKPAHSLWVQSDMIQLLPQLAAKLIQPTGHQQSAMHAALDLYNR
jgi:hypothetical protein